MLLATCTNFSIKNIKRDLMDIAIFTIIIKITFQNLESYTKANIIG